MFCYYFFNISLSTPVFKLILFKVLVYKQIINFVDYIVEILFYFICILTIYLKFRIIKTFISEVDSYLYFSNAFLILLSREETIHSKNT